MRNLQMRVIRFNAEVRGIKQVSLTLTNRERDYEVNHSNCEGGAINRGANRKEWRSENAGENGNIK